MNDLITKCVTKEEKLKERKEWHSHIICPKQTHFWKGTLENTKSTSNASHKYQGSGKPGKGQQQNVGGPKSTTFKKDTWCVRRTAPRKLTIGCSRSS